MECKVCCFIGHRKINQTDNLIKVLRTKIEELIVKSGVKTFLFGSHSQFDSLCYEIVAELQQKYCYIELVYVRAEYQFIDENYESYLLEGYDKTYFPERIGGAGKYRYVERNRHIIECSDYCMFYYNANYEPEHKKVKKSMLVARPNKSGTKLAYEYATKKDKTVINVFNML